jgi:hypothetical protein
MNQALYAHMNNKRKMKKKKQKKHKDMKQKSWGASISLRKFLHFTECALQ